MAHARERAAVAHVVERSSNSECPMSDNVDSDNAHEYLQRLIVSKITSASQAASSVGLPTLQSKEYDSRAERNKSKDLAGHVQG